MKKSKKFYKVLNLNEEETDIILTALCCFKYELFSRDNSDFKKVNNLLDKFFTEEDYLL